MKALQARQWQSVCTRADLVANAGICALVGDQQVAIFYLPRLSPSLYAIANWDPIGRANVLYRGLVTDIGGGPSVASPLYKQHFSLVTGVCLEDDSVAVPVFEIALDGDTVVIGG